MKWISQKIFQFMGFVVLCLPIFSMAEPSILLSTISKEEIQSKLKQLQTYRDRDDLDYGTRQKLTDLWSEAQEIQEMNDRCSEISLSEELDSDCDSFYRVTLPEFENHYQELTGEIRLSGTRLVASIKDKREAIETCYKAMPLHGWSPEQWLKMEGQASPEPLSDGVEVAYYFEVDKDPQKSGAWNQQVSLWYEACQEVLFRNNDRNQLAPLFIDKMKSNSEGEYLEFKLTSNKKDFDIYLKKGFSATYTLNGKELFIYSVDEDVKLGTLLLQTPHSNSTMYLELPSERYIGKQIYSDRKIRKGLEGHIVWGKYKKPTKVQTYNYSYEENEPASDYTSDQNTNINEGPKVRDYGFYFQFNTGFVMSFLSVSQELKQEFEGTINPDSTEMFTWPMTVKLRYYGRAGVIGIGTGVALSWLVSERTREKEAYSNESEPEYKLLDFYFAPVAMAEMAFGRDVEFGARGHFFFHPDRPTLMLGGYISLGDVMNLDIGWVSIAHRKWTNAYQNSNGAYVGLTVSMPTYSLYSTDEEKKH